MTYSHNFVVLISESNTSYKMPELLIPNLLNACTYLQAIKLKQSVIETKQLNFFNTSMTHVFLKFTSYIYILVKKTTLLV